MPDASEEEGGFWLGLSDIVSRCVFCLGPGTKLMTVSGVVPSPQLEYRDVMDLGLDLSGVEMLDSSSTMIKIGASNR